MAFKAIVNNKTFPKFRFVLLQYNVKENTFLIHNRKQSAPLPNLLKISLPVIVENLSKNPWMTIEEILVQHWIIVCQSLGEPGQPGGRDLLQGGLVSLVTNPPHIQDDPILAIHATISRRFAEDNLKGQKSVKAIKQKLEHPPPPLTLNPYKPNNPSNFLRLADKEGIIWKLAGA